nr:MULTISPECIES: ACT domain-containing protein [Paenibacillus]
MVDFRYNVHYTKTEVSKERTFVKERYYLVREDILPDAVIKTLRVKQLLASGDVKTVNEAVARVGLSRSAFYKYKDGIHLLNQIERESIVTISFDLEHRSGILSKVLGLIAGSGGNVLTINQSIPLQGKANVVISVETSRLTEELDEMIKMLQGTPGVRKTEIVGQG